MMFLTVGSAIYAFTQCLVIPAGWTENCVSLNQSVGMCEHMEGSFVGTETQAQPLFSRNFLSHWGMGYTGSLSAVEIAAVTVGHWESLVRGKKGRMQRLEITRI